MNEVASSSVEIPGLANVNIGQVVRDFQAAVFPAYRKFQTSTYMFDKSQDATQFSFGAYGGGGYGAGSGLSNPVYESERLSQGFKPSSFGTTQAVRSAPQASMRNFAASPEEDM